MWSFGKKESESKFALPTAITRVVGIPQMVFTNLITTIHGNRTVDHH